MNENEPGAGEKYVGSDLEDLCDLAWGVIANAGGGNWDNETTEWQEAAARWRDRWFAHLDDRVGPSRSPTTHRGDEVTDRISTVAVALHDAVCHDRTCSATVIRSVYGSQAEAVLPLLAEAKAAGYRRAIDALRDRPAYESWLSGRSFGQSGWESNAAAADFLDSRKAES
jgi:hypothetical protein